MVLQLICTFLIYKRLSLFWAEENENAFCFFSPFRDPDEMGFLCFWKDDLFLPSSFRRLLLPPLPLAFCGERIGLYIKLDF